MLKSIYNDDFKKVKILSNYNAHYELIIKKTVETNKIKILKYLLLEKKLNTHKYNIIALYTAAMENNYKIVKFVINETSLDPLQIRSKMLIIILAVSSMQKYKKIFNFLFKNERLVLSVLQNINYYKLTTNIKNKLIKTLNVSKSELKILMNNF